MRLTAMVKRRFRFNPRWRLILRCSLPLRISTGDLSGKSLHSMQASHPLLQALCIAVMQQQGMVLQCGTDTEHEAPLYLIRGHLHGW